MTVPRFPALQPSELTAEQKVVYEQIAGGPRGGVRGPFIALLHNPALAQHVQGLGEHLRFQTGLPDALVELAILVVARHWSCAYEWHAHEKLARKAGLALETIDAINHGDRPPGMSQAEEVVHDFCSEALRRGSPSDDTYDKAVTSFSRAKTLDLLALCGYYTMLALVLNTARMDIPPTDGVPLLALAT